MYISSTSSSGAAPAISSMKPVGIDQSPSFLLPTDEVADALQANRTVQESEQKGLQGVADEGLEDALENSGFLLTQQGYEFDEEDSPNNIVVDEDEDKGDEKKPARIKCASLNKLVERVTHENTSI